MQLPRAAHVSSSAPSVRAASRAPPAATSVHGELVIGRLDNLPPQQRFFQHPCSGPRCERLFSVLQWELLQFSLDVVEEITAVTTSTTSLTCVKQHETEASSC